MFFLVGPTAVGKSGLAVEVALLCNAEIVGADAFQVYQGLDLLTAKPRARLARAGPASLDRRNPARREKFDVAQYRELALERVREIESRGKRALVVGGTGFYMRALTHGLSELPGAQPRIAQGTRRDALSRNCRQRYAALDPHGIERIDRQNRRRLVRAIEVSLLAGAPFSSLRADWSGAKPCPPQLRRGARAERDRALRPHRRTRPADVRPRRDRGGARRREPGPTAAQAIGYGEIKALLRGETSRGCNASPRFSSGRGSMQNAS